MQHKELNNTNPFAKLDGMIKDTAEPTGSDWFTIAEYAKHSGYSPPHVTKLFRELHLAGKLERWEGRMKGTTGIYRRGCKFRFTPEKK